MHVLARADRALPRLVPVVLAGLLLTAVANGLLAIAALTPVTTTQAGASRLTVAGPVAAQAGSPVVPIFTQVAGPPATAEPVAPPPPPVQPAARRRAPSPAATAPPATAPRRVVAPPPAPVAPPPAPAPPPPAPPPPAPPAPPPSDAAVAEYNQRLVAAVNAERRGQGLAAVRPDGCPARYAQSHAERLAAAGRLYHQELAPVAGECSASRASENVGRGNVSPERLVAAWMASDVHRAVILDPVLTRIGSGAVRHADGQWYASHVLLNG